MLGLYHRIDIAQTAQRIYRRGDPELHWLAQLVGRGRRAIDVGANRGVYSYWLAHVCRAVEAFEPNPDLANALAKARFKGVRVHPVALSDQPGRAELIIPPHRKGGLDTPSAHLADERSQEGKHVSVALARLDSFAFADVDFMKIDVEGFEESVLEGGWATIEAARPALLIELIETLRPGCLARVTARLEALGYRASFLDQGAWLPLSRLEPPNSAPSGRFVPNFLFLPEEREPLRDLKAGASKE